MSKDTERHISWEIFGVSIERRVPAVFRVPGNPVVDLFVDRAGQRIGLLTPLPGSDRLPPSQVAAVEMHVVTRDGKHWLEVACSTSDLFREFYSFLVGVTDRIQLEHRSPVEAVSETVATLEQLLTRRALLTGDRQVGLVGELWFLNRLLHLHGPRAVDAWTGPTAEPHDFRIGSREFEVKTTTTTARIHLINGLAQLQASPGRSLYLLSIQLEAAGAQVGLSLPERVDAVRGELVGEPVALASFNERLRSAGYLDKDAPYYAIQLQLRSEAVLVRVDESFPRITRALLSSGLSDPERIREVHYSVDLEGMGVSEANPSFDETLGPTKEGAPMRSDG